METNRPNCGVESSRVESSRSISGETTGRRKKTNKVKVGPFINNRTDLFCARMKYCYLSSSLSLLGFLRTRHPVFNVLLKRLGHSLGQ